jgi:apolipoprotein N-acyltransferase
VLLLGALRPASLRPGALVAGALVAGAPSVTRRRRIAIAACGVAALAAAAGSGPLAFALTPAFPAVRQFTIALIQPGVVSGAARRVNGSQKLTAEFGRRGALARDHPGLIVWGESSVTDNLALDHAQLQRIETLAAHAHAEILASQDAVVPGPHGGQEKIAVLVSPAGREGSYTKTRLVPFGEYIPFRQQLGWLASISKAAGSNGVPGPGAHVLTVTTAGSRPLTIGVLICFESAFPDMSRVETDQGAQVIVYQSSTSTFQGTWGPDQQGSLAALRAAETGRPVVQAALTGDSVAFDARGRELAWLGQDRRGVVAVRLNLPAAADKTFYDGAGDYVMWTGVAVTGLAALIMFGRRRGFLGEIAGISGAPTAEYDTDTGEPVCTK